MATGPTSITKLFFLDANTGWAVGGIDGSSPTHGDIYKTTDGGATWNHLSNSSTWIRFYGVQFNDATTGWAYTDANGLLIKTTDGGSVWQKPISDASLSIQGMFFLDKNTGWVTGHSGYAAVVMKTTDGGATWKDYGAGLAYSLNSLHFFDANLGWAGGADKDGKVAALRTTDGGVTWTAYPVPGNPPLEGARFYSGTSGWAYGGGGTIIKFDIPTAVKNRETANPKNFALDQNYPNPFNPSTQISFSIPAAGYTTLKVFDVIGNEAATILNGNMTAGRHTVTFDARRLTSGMYFYRLQSGALSETKKLIVTK
jgi:hypothetical protein